MDSLHTRTLRTPGAGAQAQPREARRAPARRDAECSARFSAGPCDPGVVRSVDRVSGACDSIRPEASAADADAVDGVSNIRSAKCLNWSIVTRARVPRQVSLVKADAAAEARSVVLFLDNQCGDGLELEAARVEGKGRFSLAPARLDGHAYDAAELRALSSDELKTRLNAAGIDPKDARSGLGTKFTTQPDLAARLVRAERAGCPAPGQMQPNEQIVFASQAPAKAIATATYRSGPSQDG